MCGKYMYYIYIHEKQKEPAYWFKQRDNTTKSWQCLENPMAHYSISVHSVVFGSNHAPTYRKIFPLSLFILKYTILAIYTSQIYCATQLRVKSMRDGVFFFGDPHIGSYFFLILWFFPLVLCLWSVIVLVLSKIWCDKEFITAQLLG